MNNTMGYFTGGYGVELRNRQMQKTTAGPSREEQEAGTAQAAASGPQAAAEGHPAKISSRKSQLVNPLL